MNTIHANLITNTIELRTGFEVDYNSAIKEKDYNNNGVWGKIVNNGTIERVIKFNPNRWNPANGLTDYEEKLAFMKNQLSIFNQTLSPCNQ